MSSLDSIFDGWDRTFLDLSSKMTEPLCKTWELLRFRLMGPLDPQKFDNCSSRIKEIAARTIIGLGAAITGYCCSVWPLLLLGGVALLAVGS